MVIDTSILLSIFLNEKYGTWSLEQLEIHRNSLRMSTVNLTELLIILEDRQPQFFKKLQEQILSSEIRFIPPQVTHSKIAAQARLKYPLNLGDCFAYALAKEEQCPILTLDTDFKKCDVDILFP